VPGFANPAGGSIAKQPVPSGDLTGQAGQNWTPEQSPKYGTAGVPSLAVYKDVLFAVHEGWAATPVTSLGPSHAPTGQIWFTGFKNGEWKSPQDTNTNFGTTGPPAVIVYQDKLYAVHEGFGQNGQLWWTRSSSDGTTLKWENDNNTGVGTTGAPALAIYKDTLYCVHLGARKILDTKGNPTGSSDPRLYWMSFDGNSWSASTSLNVQAAGTPTLAVYHDKLYCTYQDTRNGEFWYVVYIITDQQAGNFIRDDGSAKMQEFWNELLSDSQHYALFSNVTLGGGR
jgi:hypothetical protein